VKCRHCKTEVSLQMVDLGFAPPSNAYLTEADLNKPQLYLPLRVKACEKCWLVQTEDFAQRDLLFTSNYAYFSSTSSSWVEHAKDYFEIITSELSLGSDSFVVELASNDGYLLKNFVEAEIPCLGIEPTRETALHAESNGVPTIQEFFGMDLATKLGKTYPKANLLIGNNVYAHVPDINDFTRGIKQLLAPSGTVTLEFPHLQNLILDCQFDTIYHEHYSYFSLKTVTRIFQSFGLRIFRVERLPTHGGSLRVFGCHSNDARHTEDSVAEIIAGEDASGLENPNTYGDFQKRAIEIRNDFIEFLIAKQRSGQVVVAYGAAAKGNTLLNYAGIEKDLLPMVFDAAPSKQNKFLPGTQIPVMDPLLLKDLEPDAIVVLPWNLIGEVREVLRGTFRKEPEVWVPVPHLTRLDFLP
jgi:hypothetical protein